VELPESVWGILRGELDCLINGDFLPSLKKIMLDRFDFDVFLITSDLRVDLALSCCWRALEEMLVRSIDIN
jgi:hypothetical protein